ncbi:MAG: TolC family protein [Rhizobiaceae bacterium]
MSVWMKVPASLVRLPAICFLLVLKPAQADAMTLAEAVQKALNEHPQVAASIERQIASEYRLDQTKAALLPTVDLDADVGKQWVERPESLEPENDSRWWLRRQATVNMRMILFDGFQRANAIYRDSSKIDAASLQVLENAEAVALQVVESYIDHRRHRFLLNIADENIANHQRILELTRVRLEGGKGTQSAVDQVEERLYAAKAIRAEVLQATYEADAKFKAAVGVEPTDTQRVGYPPDMPRTLADTVELAVANNTAISTRQAEAEAFSFELERTKSEIMPTLSFEGSAQAGYNLNAVPGHNNDVQLKLRLNWQIYDGGLRKARIGEASALAAEAELKRDLEVRNIRKAAETVFGKILASGLRRQAVEKQLSAARKVSSSYLSEYEASKRSLLDLLDAESAVFNSRFEQASIDGVRLFSAYYLKAITGTLLSSLGATPPSAGVPQFRYQDTSGRGGVMPKIESLR